MPDGYTRQARVCHGQMMDRYADDHAPYLAYCVRTGLGHDALQEEFGMCIADQAMHANEAQWPDDFEACQGYGELE